MLLTDRRVRKGRTETSEGSNGKRIVSREQSRRSTIPYQQSPRSRVSRSPQRSKKIARVGFSSLIATVVDSFSILFPVYMECFCVRELHVSSIRLRRRDSRFVERFPRYKSTNRSRKYKYHFRKSIKDRSLCKCEERFIRLWWK